MPGYSMHMHALILSLALAAQPKAPELDCPGGSTAKERTTPEAREAWCEDGDGLRHGTRRAWYPDGTPWFIGAYERGKRTGEWQFWYPSGARMSSGTYRNDKLHGAFTRWHDGAGKSVTGACAGGVADGLWTRWTPNERKEIEVTFADGKPTIQLYYSRRSTPIPLDDFLAEKARGATPGSKRYEMARERYAEGSLFEECKN